LPDLEHGWLRGTICLYTNTVDGHFVIDRHPSSAQVWIVSPCSGAWVQVRECDRRGRRRSGHNGRHSIRHATVQTGRQALSRARSGGGGGSRSATIVEFSNDFENSRGSISQKRHKAAVQVQNRDSGSACLRRPSDDHDPSAEPIRDRL
jgi:hypothetical protein